MNKFWYCTENSYDGPYKSAEEAKAAAVADDTTKLETRIEIHQLVEVSEAPKRTWKRR